KGLSVLKADKSHETGASVLNVLFKNERLQIFDILELQGLVEELLSLKLSVKKNKAKDDFTDALRYACSRIPFDWDKIGVKLAQPLRFEPTMLEGSNLLDKERRDSAVAQASGKSLEDEMEQEMSYWGSVYDG